MSWLVLILAGAFEVVGVIGMNKVAQKKSVGNFAFLFVGFIFSFSLLSVAMNSLPLGISYAVWTGIGTVGGAIIGMIFYGESRDVKRIICIAAIVVSVVGLRLFG